MTIVDDAQRALHARMAIACAAAAPAFPPGSLEAWTGGDLLAVRAAVPALGFLTTLTVPGDVSVAALDAALDDARWGGSSPRIVAAHEPGPNVLDRLAAGGYEPVGPRPLVTRDLRSVPMPAPALDPTGGLVVEPVPDEHLDAAIEVLLRGYEVGPEVARLIEAEHRDPRVRLLAVHGDGRPIAVAAISIHGQVAVLGGAATLPEARGRGAQAILLRARLTVAIEAGCTLATATAAAGSTSLRNLARAGFDIHGRPAFGISEADRSK
jgi:GNAT superfamily N-acetyltransferase